MTVAHSALDEIYANGSLLGFLNLGEEDNDEGNHEDSQSNEQSGSSVGNLSLRSVSNQSTHQDVACYGSRRVEHTANLNQLVARVATTAQQVQHGVNHTVQDSHAETGNQGTNKVNTEHQTKVLLGVELTAQPLDKDTNDTYYQTDEGSLLVTELGNKHTSGNTHEEVSEEVAVVANLCKNVRNLTLVLDDGCHGCTQVCHEGNHSEERNHHNNSAPLFCFLSH